MADPKPDFNQEIEKLPIEGELNLPTNEVTVAFRNEQIGEISFKCLVSPDGVVALNENSFSISFFIDCLMSGDSTKADLALKFYYIFIHKSNNGGFPERAILIVVKSVLKDMYLDAVDSSEDQGKKLAVVCSKIIADMERCGIN
jgi:hypothetical protein